MLTIFIGVQHSSAQVRKYSNEFLSIGVGAKSLGMGNAQVATTNDVTSGYWNPAGLLGVQNNLQVAAMHAEYFAGIANYDYGGLATHIDSASAIGFNLIRFAVDDIPNTTNLIDAEGNVHYDRITSFSAADYAFLVSYARKLNVPGLQVGANVKVIYRKVGDFAKAWGFGLDVGAQYERKGWLFGAMARDVTTTYNAWSFDISDDMAATFALTDNVIPENSTEITLPRLILGVARKFTIKETVNITPALDVDFTTDGLRNVLIKSDIVSIDPHMGLEVDYKDIIFLRGGLMNIQKIKGNIGSREITTVQPNFGVGLQLRNFTIDYAFTDIGDQSVGLYSHIFSLKVGINKRDDE